MRYKILVVGLLLFVILAASPQFVSADEDDWDDDDERLRIRVLRAEYIDYDSDSLEDDIITVFKVITPDDDWKRGIITIECAIEKPSGAEITTEFDVYTQEGVEITIVWYNWADEAGDYILHIKARAHSSEVRPEYIKHVFDPPGGKDDGMPEIMIMLIEEL